MRMCCRRFPPGRAARSMIRSNRAAMFRGAFRSRQGLAFFAVLVLLANGCSRPDYEIAEVEGTLLIQGRPGHKVRIEFIPDVGVVGPSAAAETDERGQFTMRVMDRDGSSPLGAVVGMHRVTLSDLQLAASLTGDGVPIRFGSEYSVSSSTPLRQEVQPGAQTIVIKVP